MNTLDKPWLTAKKFTTFLFQLLVLTCLYFTSLYSYLLFHSLVEIFTIVVGCSIFILTWHSSERIDNNYLIFLGIAYLFISGLDLIHTLSYKGMNIFTGFTANLPTQLWIAARYLQSLSLLAAPIFLRRKMNTHLVFATYTLIFTAILAAIFTGNFPVSFDDTSGLTPFKIISEYIISAILLVSIGLLIHERKSFDRNVLQWLVISLVLTIGSELAFTFYVSVYDLSNLVGHFFKLIAFYLIYRAIIEKGLEQPHQLLFRDLKQNEEMLQKSLKVVQKIAITDSLTGLYNIRHFIELAESEMEIARRNQAPLSAIMIDIDFFKNINDNYGHSVGDQTLKQVAECCLNEVRGTGLVGRYGGDEFVILLPDHDPAAAEKVARRLHELMGKLSLNESNPNYAISASLGVASLDTNDLTLESLLRRADQALYAAKENGRNQVIVYTPMRP